MRLPRRLSFVAILFGALIAMTDTTVAQTQADLDKATLAANIAEQERKAAESKNATAIAEADVAARVKVVVASFMQPTAVFAIRPNAS